MSRQSLVVRNVLVVALVLLAAFGVLLLMVIPTTGGRLSVALLAPIVAWLALPWGGSDRVCPVCRARGGKQTSSKPSVKVVTATRAGAPEGNVRVRHGWEVTATSVVTCQRCHTARELTEVRFVERRKAATGDQAIDASAAGAAPVESFTQSILPSSAASSP